MKGTRIGLIGLGRHGRRYANHLVAGDVSNATLTAFWRRDHSAAAEDAATLGVRHAPEITALITADDVDAIVLAVPAGLHEVVALQVAAAGKPLLLEKPMARTIAEAERIAAAFEAADQPLMIAQTLRFDAVVQAMKASVERIGAIRGFSFEQRLEPRGLAWEDEANDAGGGVLIQTGIHTVDALRFITGATEVAPLSCVAQRLLYTNNEDSVTAILRARGGRFGDDAIIGNLGVSKVGPSRHVRFALFGAEGALEGDLVARTLTHRQGRGQTVEPVVDSPTIVDVMKAFVRHVADHNEPNLVPGRDALASLKIVTDCYAQVQLTGGNSS